MHRIGTSVRKTSLPLSVTAILRTEDQNSTTITSPRSPSSALAEDWFPSMQLSSSVTNFQIHLVWTTSQSPDHRSAPWSQRNLRDLFSGFCLEKLGVLLWEITKSLGDHKVHYKYDSLPWSIQSSIIIHRQKQRCLYAGTSKYQADLPKYNLIKILQYQYIRFIWQGFSSLEDHFLCLFL